MRTWLIFLACVGFLTFSCLESLAASKGKTSLFQSAINARKQLVKEEGVWWGLHNGGRPTFYFAHYMKDYPPAFIMVQDKCETVVVENDGHRFETNKIIVKQSDVGGRGMALTNQVGQCTASRSAFILYFKEDMPREDPPVITY